MIMLNHWSGVDPASFYRATALMNKKFGIRDAAAISQRFRWLDQFRH